MNWVEAYIAAPYRNAMATVTSFGPFKYFSLAEILITLLVLWVLYYLIKTIIFLIARPHRLLVLGRRLFVIAVVGLYIFAAYSWLWGTGYHSTDLADKTGLNPSGITVAQLTNVTKLFAEKANELSTRSSATRTDISMRTQTIILSCQRASMPISSSNFRSSAGHHTHRRR